MEALSYLIAVPLLAAGISLVVRGLLRRKAERRALAIEKGIPLSEIERPRPITSISLGTAFLVLVFPLFNILQNDLSTKNMLLFGVFSAAGLALLVRGSLLRKAEKRFLTETKGIHFSSRRRAKLTKSLLLGIGFIVFSVFFISPVIEQFSRGDYDLRTETFIFAVLFTLGLVFLIRALLLRKPRPQKLPSTQIDPASAKAASP